MQEYSEEIMKVIPKGKHIVATQFDENHSKFANTIIVANGGWCVHLLDM